MKGSKRHNRHRTPKVINKGLDYELLAKNVFLLQKNRDIILAHEDMRNCVLNVKNYVSINYCDLNYMPLSGYFEWWDKAQEVMHTNEDGKMGIVIRWATPHCTGGKAYTSLRPPMVRVVLFLIIRGGILLS